MTKYRFNGEIFDTIEEAENAIYDYADDTYDDFLDECYEEVAVGSTTYPYSIVLKRVDEVMYRCGISDYEDMLHDDIEEFEEDEEDEDEE